MTWGELKVGDVLMMSDGPAAIIRIVRLEHVPDRTTFQALTLESGRVSTHTLPSSMSVGFDLKVLRGEEELP